MLKLAVFSILLVAALSQDLCTPDQWESKAGIITGTVTMGKTLSTEIGAGISYDLTGQRVAVSLASQNFMNKTIINYNEQLLYQIDNRRDACTVKRFDMPFKKACLPAGSMPLGKFYYGAGDNRLDAQAYKIKVNDVTGFVDFTMLDSNIIPIAEIVFGTVGPTSFMSSIGIVDVTLGIKNPDVFTPPSFCQQAKITQLKEFKAPVHSKLGIPFGFME